MQVFYSTEPIELIGGRDFYFATGAGRTLRQAWLAMMEEAKGLPDWRPGMESTAYALDNDYMVTLSELEQQYKDKPSGYWLVGLCNYG